MSDQGQVSTNNRNNDKRLINHKETIIDDTGDTTVEYTILIGEAKKCKYGSMNLLVPSDDVTKLLEALTNADCGYFEWSIDEDETITDIRYIPSSVALPVRTLPDTYPKDKTEGELLDLVIHGESYFSKKYVILSFMCEAHNWYDTVIEMEMGKAVFEISKKEYLPFYEYCKKLYDHSKRDPEVAYLDGCDLVDEATYQMKELPSNNCTNCLVDNDLMGRFKAHSEDKYIGEWADDYYLAKIMNDRSHAIYLEESKGMQWGM